MQPRQSKSWSGVPLGLGAAALFGASTPFAKLLLGDGVSPWLLAGLLYLGSGVGLGGLYVVRRLVGGVPSEAPLRRSDLPWLLLVILSGGVIGPLLLMFGLKATPASSAALLLNLEGLSTMLIAWIVFRESTDRRLIAGAMAILAGAVLLAWNGPVAALNWGALAIAGACLAWAVDNNLTRKLSGSDPIQITAAKGLVAGVTNLALARYEGSSLPGGGAIAGAVLVGFFGYGVSLVMFVLSLRNLGAARTGAYFSTAPFIGASLGLIVFHEPLTVRLLSAAVLMAAGVYLHLAERHEHEHAHEAMEHEHSHTHDAHHQHAHAPDAPPGEPHTHWHRHEPLVHSHPHYPDLHHRHEHA